MTKDILDQYATLKAKKSLSAEEKAVLDAIVASAAAEEKILATATATPESKEADDVLEDAQEALTAKPSTTA
jgi:hypothetical protein